MSLFILTQAMGRAVSVRFNRQHFNFLDSDEQGETAVGNRVEFHDYICRWQSHPLSHVTFCEESTITNAPYLSPCFCFVNLKPWWGYYKCVFHSSFDFRCSWIEDCGFQKSKESIKWNISHFVCGSCCGIFCLVVNRTSIDMYGHFVWRD